MNTPEDNEQAAQAKEDSERQRFADARHAMVEFQIAHRGIKDRRVQQAMGNVPREEFVPDAFREEAYADWPLPIGYGQTISQPFTVAYMAQAALLEGPERVLEVGSGSGYGAAVLSQLAAVVHSVERVPELADAAARRTKRLGYANVTVHVANGTLGLREHAPFDAIVVTAAAEALPEPYGKQLSEGGRIVIPIGKSTSQFMYRFTKRNGELDAENLGGFAFVPLIGEYGCDESQAGRLG